MRFFTILYFLLLQSYFSLGQAESNLSSQNVKPLEIVGQTAYPISLYKEATAQSQNLYNGRVYYLYDSKSEEHQFFGDRHWQKGVVFYDGQQFDSIPMIYDIVKDELIIKHFYGDHLLLQSEKVSYFIRENRVFKRYESGKEINANMRTGFYDILYDGKTKAIIRRGKQRQEKIVDKKVISLFPEKDFYFIKKGDQYHSVRSKRSVFGLFPEQKKELRKALRDERIKFRKNRDAAIAKIVVTYDAIAKP